MNIGAETEFSITCNRFDSMSLEVRDITKEKSSIAKMLKGIRVNDTKYSNVDTRSKLYIYYTSGRVDQYCFHRFNNCLKNGSPMLLLNTDLPYYLDSMRQAFKLPD
jgi:hypothetical protein